VLPVKCDNPNIVSTSSDQQQKGTAVIGSSVKVGDLDDSDVIEDVRDLSVIRSDQETKRSRDYRMWPRANRAVGLTRLLTMDLLTSLTGSILVIGTQQSSSLVSLYSLGGRTVLFGLGRLLNAFNLLPSVWFYDQQRIVKTVAICSIWHCVCQYYFGLLTFLYLYIIASNAREISMLLN